MHIEANGKNGNEFLLSGFGLLQIIFKETNFTLLNSKLIENELGSIHILNDDQNNQLNKYIGFSYRKLGNFLFDKLYIKFIIISHKIKRFIDEFSKVFNEIVG